MSCEWAMLEGADLIHTVAVMKFSCRKIYMEQDEILRSSGPLSIQLNLNSIPSSLHAWCYRMLLLCSSILLMRNFTPMYLDFVFLWAHLFYRFFNRHGWCNFHNQSLITGARPPWYGGGHALEWATANKIVEIVPK